MSRGAEDNMESQMDESFTVIYVSDTDDCEEQNSQHDLPCSVVGETELPSAMDETELQSAIGETELLSAMDKTELPSAGNSDLDHEEGPLSFNSISCSDKTSPEMSPGLVPHSGWQQSLSSNFHVSEDKPSKLEPSGSANHQNQMSHLTYFEMPQFGGAAEMTPPCSPQQGGFYHYGNTQAAAPVFNQGQPMHAPIPPFNMQGQNFNPHFHAPYPQFGMPYQPPFNPAMAIPHHWPVPGMMPGVGAPEGAPPGAPPGCMPFVPGPIYPNQAYELTRPTLPVSPHCQVPVFMSTVHTKVKSGSFLPQTDDSSFHLAEEKTKKRISSVNPDKNMDGHVKHATFEDGSTKQIKGEDGESEHSVIEESHCVFIENASRRTPSDCIRDFLEAKASLNVENIEAGSRRGSFLVRFDKRPNFAKLQNICMKTPIDDSWLKVSRVLKPTCVKVTNTKSSKDSLRWYFLNSRKSDGGEIKEIEMSEDEKTAFVYFVSPEVAERVCRKEHVLDGNTLQVSLINEYLEAKDSLKHSGGRKDRPTDLKKNLKPEKQKKHDASETETKLSKKANKEQESPAKRSVNVPLPTEIARFLKARAPYQEKLKAHVWEKFRGKIRFIEQPQNKLVLLVENAETKLIGKTDIKRYVAKYILQELNIACSKVTVDEQLKKETLDMIGHVYQTHEQHLKVFMSDTTFSLVGDKEAVKMLYKKLRNLNRSFEQICEEFHAQKHKLQFLKMSKLENKFPNVDIKFDSATGVIQFQGPASDVAAARKSCDHHIEKLVIQDITFKFKDVETLAESLKASNFFQREFSDLCCFWECVQPGNIIRVYGEEETSVKAARAILERGLTEFVIPLDGVGQNMLENDDWKQYKMILLQKHLGKLVMSEQEGKLCFVAVSEIRDAVQSDVNTFLKNSSVKVLTVPLEPPIARFMQAFKMDTLRSFEDRNSKNKLSIVLNKVSHQINISGCGESTEEAKNFIQGLTEKIICTQHRIQIPGVEQFFLKGRGRELLTAIGQRERYLIEPKVMASKGSVKVIKQWNIHGRGVLSVLLGDMTELNVDAIVNAANGQLHHAGGLAETICKKGGPSIQRESDEYIKQNGQLSEGDVMVTGGSYLLCRMIIHAIGPMWHGGTRREKELLQKTVKNILNAGRKKRCGSVAIPAISSGIFRYPEKQAVSAIVEALGTSWEVDPEDTEILKYIYLCAINQKMVDLFVGAVDRVFGTVRRQEDDDDDDDDDDNVYGSGSNFEHHDSETEDAASQNYSESESEEDSASTRSQFEPEDLSKRGVIIVCRELAETQVDVLVTSAQCDLNMSALAVSRSLSKAAGTGLENECRSKYPDGINFGEVAVTGGYQLPCKAVFYGVLMNWNSGKGKGDEILKRFMKKCLAKAAADGYSSIAFPALGTGKTGYPADIAANLLMNIAYSYLNDNPNSMLQTVVFVVHPNERAVLKAFCGEKEKCTGIRTDPETVLASGRTRSPAQRTPSPPSSSDDLPKVDPPPSTDTFHLGPVTVKIVQGDLIKETTDCILHAMKESCDLRYSVISKSISTMGGPGIQKECSEKRSAMQKYGFILTSGGQLECKVVAHVKVQDSDLTWTNILTKCLTRINSRNLTSLSIPALGTGGLKQSAEKMAKVICNSIKQFGTSNQLPKLKFIRLVIFQESMVESFRNVFAQSGFPQSSRTTSVHHHRGQASADGVRSRHKRSVTANDSITMCIYAEDEHSASLAKQKLASLCKEEFDRKELQKVHSEFLESLNANEVSVFYKIVDDNEVSLTKTRTGFVLTGRTKPLSTAYEKIVEKIYTLQNRAKNQSEARMVSKLVEWTYYDERGRSHLFTPGLTCKLEKAHNEKLRSVDIIDPRGRKYVVDLKKMVEIPDGGGKPIKILRTEKGGSSGLGQYVEGEKEALSGTKTVYFSLKPERNFKGSADELHFRTAESQFYRLLSNQRGSFKVVKVEYVVNPALVKRFRAAKEDLKQRRGEKYAESILAFHGTNEGNIKSICETGFQKKGDPGFAMKSGNKYGDGVYFSEYPDYSMGYIRGSTKLLLNKVLLGKTYTIKSYQAGGSVQAGYDSHTSADGKELVIFDTERILPCYIVHYQQR